MASSEIRVAATHLPFDTSRLRDATASVRAIDECMLRLIPVYSEVDSHLSDLKKSGSVDRAIRLRLEDVARWIEAGSGIDDANRLVSVLEAEGAACKRESWNDIVLEGLYRALARSVRLLAAAHSLLQHICSPSTPLSPMVNAALSKGAQAPLHRDTALAFRSAAATFIATMITCCLWIYSGWQDGASAAALCCVLCALFATLDDPAPIMTGFGVVTLVGLGIATIYEFGVLPAVDGFAALAIALAPLLLILGYLLARPKTQGLALGLVLGFLSGLALQETYTADFAAFMNGNLPVYAGLFIAIFVVRIIRSMTTRNSMDRFATLVRSTIVRVARRDEPGMDALLMPMLIDRLALLSQRLAIANEGGEFTAATTLRDFRVATSLISIRRVMAIEKAFEPSFSLVLTQLAAFYEQSVRSENAAPPAGLLTDLDSALREYVHGAPNTDRRFVIGIARLRQDLFPMAAAPVLLGSEPNG